MSNVLAVETVTKRYSGKTALEGCSLTVPPGCIVGLLGPNGSGKTTLMKIVSGLLQPDSGRFIGPGGTAGREAKASIAFMPDAMKLPGWMRVKDAFDYVKDFYPDYSSARRENMMRLLDLDPEHRVASLSKGMQERVCLGMTLCREAKLFLLDEPLGGIDPVGKARITDAILSMELGDSSVVISTHLVRDIERLFDRVHFIHQGKVVYSGDCDEMRESQGKTVEQMYLEVFGYV